MRQFDLALIFVSFQRCCCYLSLIKELSRTYRIAVCPQDVDENTTIRTSETRAAFLQLCSEMGADIMDTEPVKADIALLPQSNYTKATMDHINANVVSRKTYWLSGLAMGNAQYEYLHGKPIDKVLVIDKKLYQFRIEEYESPRDHKFPPEDIVEVGLPYAKYPVFPDCPIDYLWANPTPFSFKTMEDRLEYMDNVYHLIQQTDPDDTIALKPHNADERTDYIIQPQVDALVSLFIFRPFYGPMERFFRRLVRKKKAGRLTDLACQVLIVLTYKKLLKRVIPFKNVTPHHNLNLELFLPHVKKGLITGRSNSIWHGLYNRIPVYNCICEDKPYFSAGKMHTYTMKYMKVHGTHTSLSFPDHHYDLIAPHTRQADLIEYIKSQLSSFHTGAGTTGS